MAAVIDKDTLAAVWTWVSASAVSMSFSVAVAVTLFVFLASHFNKNYSWVDRSWSIVPVVYTWIEVWYTMSESETAPDLVNVATTYATIITLWGIRLTYNFYRRGGYSRGGEDYRWNEVATWPIVSIPLVWVVFNFVVISTFQSMLLWAITLPVVSLPATPLTPKDTVFAAAMIFFLFFETLCDNQQWAFQNAKRRSKSGYLGYGFCITGTFGYSRHLNVFCEGSFWVSLAVAAYAQHWSAPWWQYIGCIALELLTLFSTGVITENLSRRKYPLYAVYQSTTPMLIPALTSTTPRTAFLLEQRKSKRS